MLLQLRPSFFDQFPVLSPSDLRASQVTPGVLASKAEARVVRAPQVLMASELCARLLDLSLAELTSSEAAQILSGNKTLEGSQPLATRYGGHQFGHWAGQLGDGRALLLGETVNKAGEVFEIQLKGAGETPYSRRADGRAVLRSSLREFLCSEAMFHLGVPTTRALALTLTGENVVRDMLYDGNPAEEPGAIVTRVAPSFLRLGHFEILAANQEFDLLKTLIEKTAERYFLIRSSSLEQTTQQLFEEVCQRTARLMAEWLRVGFVHGVMNTDNLSVLGLTIDYGPYGWIDAFDADWTPNTTDREGRYAFAQQPQVADWNLLQWGRAMGVVLKDPQILSSGLQLYRETFETEIFHIMLAKLGLQALGEDKLVVQLIQDLDAVFRESEIDMTIFYRLLGDLDLVEGHEFQVESLLQEHFQQMFYDQSLSKKRPLFEKWLGDYVSLSMQNSQPRDLRKSQMDRVNPAFVLRNYLVQEALEDFQARGFREKIDRLMKALRAPYEMNQFTAPFFQRRPDWAKNKPGCSALSCSS